MKIFSSDWRMLSPTFKYISKYVFKVIFPAIILLQFSDDNRLINIYWSHIACINVLSKLKSACDNFLKSGEILKHQLNHITGITLPHSPNMIWSAKLCKLQPTLQKSNILLEFFVMIFQLKDLLITLRFRYFVYLSKSVNIGYLYLFHLQHSHPLVKGNHCTKQAKQGKFSSCKNLINAWNKIKIGTVCREKYWFEQILKFKKYKEVLFQSDRDSLHYMALRNWTP